MYCFYHHNCNLLITLLLTMILVCKFHPSKYQCHQPSLDQTDMSISLHLQPSNKIKYNKKITLSAVCGSIHTILKFLYFPGLMLFFHCRYHQICILVATSSLSFCYLFTWASIFPFLPVFTYFLLNSLCLGSTVSIIGNTSFVHILLPIISNIIVSFDSQTTMHMVTMLHTSYYPTG